MILCHFIFIHALYGGFFGLIGIVGAILPDVTGIVGWLRYMRADIKIAGNDWWDYMPDMTKAWYQVMHSIWFVLVVLISEMMLRLTINILSFGFGCSWWPLFTIGYATHVVSDAFTHRRDSGTLLLVETGRMFGVDWYRSRWYWTEWTGLALCTVVVWMGCTNVIIEIVKSL